mgnify:CR=1 FL=1
MSNLFPPQDNRYNPAPTNVTYILPDGTIAHTSQERRDFDIEIGNKFMRCQEIEVADWTCKILSVTIDRPPQGAPEIVTVYIERLRQNSYDWDC